MDDAPRRIRVPSPSERHPTAYADRLAGPCEESDYPRASLRPERVLAHLLEITQPHRITTTILRMHTTPAVGAPSRLQVIAFGEILRQRLVAS